MYVCVKNIQNSSHCLTMDIHMSNTEIRHSVRKFGCIWHMELSYRKSIYTKILSSSKCSWSSGKLVFGSQDHIWCIAYSLSVVCCCPVAPSVRVGLSTAVFIHGWLFIFTPPARHQTDTVFIPGSACEWLHHITSLCPIDCFFVICSNLRVVDSISVHVCLVLIQSYSPNTYY